MLIISRYIPGLEQQSCNDLLYTYLCLSLFQKLTQELVLKEAQLKDLQHNCEKLQDFPNVSDLAESLLGELRILQQTIHDSTNEVKIRQALLQVLANTYQLAVIFLTVFTESLQSLWYSFVSQISVFQNTPLA